MPQADRWFEGMPMVHAPTYDNVDPIEYLSKSELGRKFLDLRNNSDFLVISHMRHKWRSGLRY